MAYDVNSLPKSLVDDAASILEATKNVDQTAPEFIDRNDPNKDVPGVERPKDHTLGTVSHRRKYNHTLKQDGTMQPVKEAQVDELSKKTLATYADKAKAKAGSHKALSLHAFINKDDGKGFDHDAKAKKREAGAAKAAKKIHEGEEQVDELSKKTVGSYVKKATDDIRTKSHNAGYALGKGDIHKGVAGFAKVAKRTDNVDKAVNRLTKEDSTTVPGWLTIKQQAKIAEAAKEPKEPKDDASDKENSTTLSGNKDKVDVNPTINLPVAR